MGAHARAVVAAFNQALKQEAHTLARMPKLISQQLFNRVQWLDESVASRLASSLSKQGEQSTHLWLRTLRPFSESKALVRTLEGHTDEVFCCAISPNGARVASGSADCTIKVWEIASGQLERTLIGHAKAPFFPIRAIAFSPAGTLLVSGGDLEMIVWDVASGVTRSRFDTPNGVKDCVFSHDGSSVISVSGDGLNEWDLDTGRTRRTLPEAHGETCCISPDGAHVLVSGLAGPLDVWDLSRGERVALYNGRAGEITPDGTAAVAVDTTIDVADPALQVRELTSGEELIRIRARTEINACAMSPDARLIISANDDSIGVSGLNTLSVWNISSGDEVSTLFGHVERVNDCVISPDGRSFVSGSSDHTLKVWEFASDQNGGVPVAHTRTVYDCAFSPDGASIASASGDGTLKVWDLATGDERLIWQTEEDAVACCAFSPDGAVLVSGSGLDLRVWDLLTGKQRDHFRVDGGVIKCAVSTDSSLAVFSSGQWIETLDLTGEKRQGFSGSHGSDYDVVFGCCISPDVSTLVSAGRGRLLKVWNLASGEEQFALGRGDQGVKARCALSPDGGTVVLAGNDGILRAWNLATGEYRWELRGHNDEPLDCAFTPDAAAVVSASADRTLRVWDLESGQELAMIALPGPLQCVTAHPWLPVFGCGAVDGSLHLIELVGIDLGPAVITPVDSGDGVTLRCPKCWHGHVLNEQWRGSVINCPSTQCDLQLRVNPFIVRHPAVAGPAR